jgi:hypothetical protein
MDNIGTPKEAEFLDKFFLSTFCNIKTVKAMAGLYSYITA